MSYEVIVVGAGHAGCEAALASARTNKKTLLITSNLNNIADLPCNPSIGGSAKGIVVREIDALGGEMGKLSDRSHVQIKQLNQKKGPAVRALRAQIDKRLYPTEMKKTLEAQKNLTMLEAMVEDLVIVNEVIKGVKLDNGEIINGLVVILTTGTYLKSDILIGDKRWRSGPNKERPSIHLSDNLKKHGFEIIRLKTGTPPRIDKNTIDYSKMKIETGDSNYLYFSHDEITPYNINDQLPCYLTYTNLKMHNIINENLTKSSMYGGITDLESVGPRYCPSIEDKVVRFRDKDRHQIFLEPESRFTDEIYIQGLSTSLPHDVQEKLIESIPGLENAKILKYAYAIEYDAINPTSLKRTLETKLIKNLYAAGQINGTSGYEEAACQGLIAGINASLSIDGKPPIVLNRNEAYIGVLIDDLVTKGVIDPYRLLTSRAEYRLLLRHDNADLRLRSIGYNVGLIDEKRYQKLNTKINDIKSLSEELKHQKLTPTKEVNKYLQSINSAELKDGLSLYELLRRPEITIDKLKKYFKVNYEEEVVEQVAINIKYEGYIAKAKKEADKMMGLENKKIPENIDYNLIHNLASEAKQKLSEIKPMSIGQALRISGVNPSDISILMVYLKKGVNND